MRYRCSDRWQWKACDGNRRGTPGGQPTTPARSCGPESDAVTRWQTPSPSSANVKIQRSAAPYPASALIVSTDELNPGG